MIGRPDSSSWSFANATIDPAKETEPISAERTIASEMSAWSRLAGGARLWNSASDTRAAAPPPTPLNSATICGIAVIFTLRAPTAPNAPPIAAPTMIRQFRWTPGRASVTPIAHAIPNAPIQLPFRACFGDERNRSARMKQTIVTR